MNVVRSVGMSLGIATASALLSWRLEVLTGKPVSTIGAAPAVLFGAGRSVSCCLSASLRSPASSRSPARCRLDILRVRHPTDPFEQRWNSAFSTPLRPSAVTRSVMEPSTSNARAFHCAEVRILANP